MNGFTDMRTSLRDLDYGLATPQGTFRRGGRKFFSRVILSWLILLGLVTPPSLTQEPGKPEPSEGHADAQDQERVDRILARPVRAFPQGTGLASTTAYRWLAERDGRPVDVG